MPANVDRLDIEQNYAEFIKGLQDAYTGRAPTYDESKFHRDLAFDFANDFLADSKGKPFLNASSRVLDLCCGTGLVTFEIISKMMSDPQADNTLQPGLVVGVDITEALLDQARSKILISALRESERKPMPMVEFYEADVTQLAAQVPQLEKESFDLVCICSALGLLHFEAIPQAIAHWASYLRPGGKLLFDIPGPDSQPFAHGKTMAYIFGERDMEDATARCWVESAPARETWAKISDRWINCGNSPDVIQGALKVANELVAHGSEPELAVPSLRIEKLFVTDKVYDKRVRNATPEYVDRLWESLRHGPTHFHTEAVNEQLQNSDESRKMKGRLQQAITDLVKQQGRESEEAVDEFRFFICLAEKVM